MTRDEIQRVIDGVHEIHRLLDEAYAHYFALGDGYHKSQEGTVWVEWPNHFERAGGNTEPRVGIYSYVFADAREDIFDSIDEALDAVREWHSDEMARTYEED